MTDPADNGWQMVVPDERIFRRGNLGGKGSDLRWGGVRIELPDGRPIPDATYHEIGVLGLVDRLPTEQLIPFWRELYRICRHGAVVTVVGAYWSHVDAWADPTRRRGLSERMFAYLSSEERKAIEADPHEDDVAIDLLRDVDLRPTKITRVTEQDWDTRSDEAKNWGLRHAINVARRLEVVLVAHKLPAGAATTP